MSELAKALNALAASLTTRAGECKASSERADAVEAKSIYLTTGLVMANLSGACLDAATALEADDLARLGIHGQQPRELQGQADA